jgi:hypothetical protein
VAVGNGISVGTVGYGGKGDGVGKEVEGCGVGDNAVGGAVDESMVETGMMVGTRAGVVTGEAHPEAKGIRNKSSAARFPVR